jgi:dTDP-4-dehydrorhamnose reductase
MPTILITGGSGRLGSELRSLLPHLIAPSRQELDVTDDMQVNAVFQRYKPDVVVHAAAYTNVAQAEVDRDTCWHINVVGTRNVARAASAVGAKLVHISTDYVFSGEIGNYGEDDTPGPVANYYALTKLVAEEAARGAARSLIIRTSFRPREFQHPVAYADVFTSQDYVDIIAPMLCQVIGQADRISQPILHVATERKSVFELASRRNSGVKSGSRINASVQIPRDTSLKLSSLLAQNGTDS